MEEVIMRALFTILAIALLVLPATAGREIEGAEVTLVSPISMGAGQVYTFEFWVQNESSDAEWITDVQISFPDGFTLYPETMGFAELATGRPSWDMYIPPVDHTAIWEDNDAGYGEIYSTEGTLVWIDCLTPTEFYTDCIYWTLIGDEYGAEPHTVCGCISFVITAVEDATWGAIKAMYR